MKKFALMTGLLSVLTAPAMGETKWFVGANVGFAGPVLSDDINDAIDDNLFDDNSGTLVTSLTGGMRFGEHDKIYNGGASLTLSYMPNLVRISDGSAYPLNMDAKGDLTTLYMSYDNYIKISGDAKCRTDFIISLGLGYGWSKETLDIDGYASESASDNGTMAALKFGFGGETVVDGLGWNVMLSFIGLNAKDDADIQGAYSIDFGLKYTF
ncbi:MAG: hypothetical protein NC311_04495 [Muribaculaceae bacterium]|nr:hypothetical protein [Muribaculaceae bacterium]